MKNTTKVFGVLIAAGIFLLPSCSLRNMSKSETKTAALVLGGAVVGAVATQVYILQTGMYDEGGPWPEERDELDGYEISTMWYGIPLTILGGILGGAAGYGIDRLTERSSGNTAMVSESDPLPANLVIDRMLSRGAFSLRE